MRECNEYRREGEKSKSNKTVECGVTSSSVDSMGKELTGFSFFLSSALRVPPLRAMIGGAASGSWAMGEPHSGQKIRWTSWPEEPLLENFLVLPEMVSLSLGTTTTRAVLYRD